MAIGWGTFFGGIGTVLEKVSTYIPGKIEKLKNEQAKLKEEEATIEKLNLDIDKGEDRSKAQRLTVIRKRIADIDRVLGNKAKD